MLLIEKQDIIEKQIEHTIKYFGNRKFLSKTNVKEVKTEQKIIKNNEFEIKAPSLMRRESLLTNRTKNAIKLAYNQSLIRNNNKK